MAGQRMGLYGAVACGNDAGMAGPRRTVYDDSACGVQAKGTRQFQSRYDTNADDDQVGRNATAVGEVDCAYVAFVRTHRDDLSVQSYIHTTPPMRLFVERGHHGRHRATDQSIRGVDQGHVLADAPSHCGIATGVPIRRTLAIAITTFLAFSASAFVVFLEDLTDSLTAFLTLMVIWSSAWCGMFLAELAVRHVQYDTLALHAVGPRPYWYRNGWNLCALGWFIVGAIGSALTAQSPIFSGPLVRFIGIGDLPIPAGLIISGVGFYVHNTIKKSNLQPIEAR